jgi:hypothetical protein
MAMSSHRRRLFDGLVPPVSKCPVQSTRPVDVISADPRTIPFRVAWLTAVTVLLAAALTGAILIAHAGLLT